MIEAMLEAERALAVGLLDQAERLYAQVVAADPRNAIAVVGLARVALERDDQRGAFVFARRALVLDPDNPMASHLSRRMAELMTNRGEALPGDDDIRAGAQASASQGRADAARADAARDDAAHDAPRADGGDDARRSGDTSKAGLVDRLLRRRR